MKISTRDNRFYICSKISVDFVCFVFLMLSHISPNTNLHFLIKTDECSMTNNQFVSNVSNIFKTHFAKMHSFSSNFEHLFEKKKKPFLAKKLLTRCFFSKTKYPDSVFIRFINAMILFELNNVPWQVDL